MRNKVPDGAKRGTAFFRPKFPKETGSQRTLIFTIFGVNFGRNQTRVVRCINRGVLQFLEPGHLRFERRDHRQRTTPYLENTVQYTSNFGGFGGCPPPSPPLVGRGGGKSHGMRLRHDHKTPSTVAFQNNAGEKDSREEYCMGCVPRGVGGPSSPRSAINAVGGAG